MRTFSLALLGAAALSACGPNKIETGLAKPPTIPELPASLAIKAKALPPLVDNTMGGSQIQGASDDEAYNTVSHQLNKLIDLYNCVRDSFNSKNTKDCNVN